MAGPRPSRYRALSSNDGDIVLNWALAGQGIVIRSEWDVAKYLDSGRLRQILPEFSLPSADLFAYYLGSRNLAARSRAFINHLVETWRAESRLSLPSAVPSTRSR